MDYKQKLTMPFGKHKGELIEDVPASYLLWVLAEIDDLDLHVKSWIEDNEDELRQAAKDEERFKGKRYSGFTGRY